VNDEIRTIKVIESLLSGNDAVAAANRIGFHTSGVLCLNLIAGPGAGKTSLIAATIRALRGRLSVGVIEGDIAGSVDTETVLAAGAADAVQINTGGRCHLEADMIAKALARLDLAAIDLLVIENVGNLICPTSWDLGEALKIALVGAAEGDDKPIKYPTVFARADAVILNKIDLIDAVDFDRTRFHEALRALNPDAPLFELSCRTGEGMSGWVEWVGGRVSRGLTMGGRVGV
jgi:hydrogenase nickel incorporation protein HypB